MKPTTILSKVIKVRQVIETDDLAAANVFLKSGNWILLNSYMNRKMSTTPLFRLGKISSDDNDIDDIVINLLEFCEVFHRFALQQVCS